MMSVWSRDEERTLRRQLSEGVSPTCPRCGNLVKGTPVHPRTDVAYVRRRILLECADCSCRAALDDPSGGTP